MSVAAPARLQPARTRPTLRLVTPRRLVVGRLPFAILVGSLLTLGLLGLLMLHTLAAQDAFRLQRLQHAQAALSDTEQQLALANQQLSAPASLARRARALGMVPGGAIAFVKVGHHGRIIGVAHAAAPAPPPAPPTTKPTKSPTARHHHAAVGTKPTSRRPVRTKRHHSAQHRHAGHRRAAPAKHR
ncbi:MAG: hypothetical protein JO222_07885 [Frankiales bacterium]|nr:hypothetical protein [Frankiales bacterium]